MGKRGPVTEAGKAAVRLNPLKHGVLSQTPVLPLVEKVEDWLRLRAGIFEYFAVVGMMEEALADLIAMLVWRRYRLVRFETDSISRYLEEVPADYGRRRGSKGESTEELSADEIEEMDRMISARLLPGAETAEKIMRYETKLHRFLMQTINQLLVLQAIRKGDGGRRGAREGSQFPEDGEYFPGSARGRAPKPRSLRATEGVLARAVEQSAKQGSMRTGEHVDVAEGDCDDGEQEAEERGERGAAEGGVLRALPGGGSGPGRAQPNRAERRRRAKHGRSGDAAAVP